MSTTKRLPREERSRLLKYEDADFDEYKYTPLAEGKRRIRLLELRSGVIENPEIDCEMFEAEFINDHQLVKVDCYQTTTPPNPLNMDEELSGMTSGDSDANDDETETDKKKAEGKTKRAERKKRLRGRLPKEVDKKHLQPYEALSWRWGDEPNGENVVLIRKGNTMCKKRVSRTLGLALKYLRDSKGSRFLWVDALCIDQGDTKERSSQVAMMSLVYKAASQVCVWLGEDDDDADLLAMSFIKRRITSLKNFDSLSETEEYAAEWKALFRLMQKDWFSRRWVIQEIALAHEATVYCGPEYIQWSELAIAVELVVEVETATNRLSELMKKDKKGKVIPNWFEHISQLGASLLVNATATIFRDFKRSEIHSDSQDEEALAPRSLLSLEYLVTSLSLFDCAIPHDSIYALLETARDTCPFPPKPRPIQPGSSVHSQGESNPKVPHDQTKEGLVASVFEDVLEQKPYTIDYSRSYTRVCREFVEFCIKRAAHSDSKQALDILCRPWAKDPLPKASRQIPREGWGKGERSIWRMVEGVVEGVDDGVDDGVVKMAESRPSTEPEANSGEAKPKSTEMEKKEEEDCYWCKLEANDKGPKVTIKDGQRLWKNKGGEEKERSGKPLESSNPCGKIHLFIQKWDLLTKSLALKREQSQTSNPRTGKKRAKDGEKTPEKEQGAKYIVLKEKELELPSWVARVRGAPFDIFPHPGMDMVKMGRKNADPLVGIPQDGHRNYSAGQSKGLETESMKIRERALCGHYSLYVKGFRFDEVAEVGQVSHLGAIPASWLEMAGWEEARVAKYPYKNLTDPPVQFWRTLVANRGKNGRNPPYYYARACKESFMKGGLQGNAVNTTALISDEQNSIISEFCRRVQSVIWNRALIKTQSGRLGLAPETVRPGDFVCIIYGCTVPVILRPGKWKEDEEKKMEDLEDQLMVLKEHMENRYRKEMLEKKFEESVKSWQNSVRKYHRRYLREPKKPRPTDDASKGKEKITKEAAILYLRDSWSEDDTTDTESSDNRDDTDVDVSGDDGDGDSKGKRRATKASLRDPFRHYTFIGEAYIHGMMDGDAVRRKFYKHKPDHMFEIR
jgi:hypothetical protein